MAPPLEPSAIAAVRGITIRKIAGVSPCTVGKPSLMCQALIRFAGSCHIRAVCRNARLGQAKRRYRGHEPPYATRSLQSVPQPLPLRSAAALPPSAPRARFARGLMAASGAHPQRLYKAIILVSYTSKAGLMSLKCFVKVKTLGDSLRNHDPTTDISKSLF